MTDVPLPKEMAFESKRYKLVELPRVRWVWHVFGARDTTHGYVRVECTYDPPLWRRIVTRIFLGSRWERVS